MRLGRKKVKDLIKDLEDMVMEAWMEIWEELSEEERKILLEELTSGKKERNADSPETGANSVES